MNTHRFTQFMNEMGVYKVKNEERHRDNRELFHLIQKLAPKSRAVTTVEALKIFLDSYKQGINEGAKRP